MLNLKSGIVQNQVPRVILIHLKISIHFFTFFNDVFLIRECDMVSLGRALVADPELPNKMAQGAAATECTFCNECVARAGVHPVDCYDPKVNPRFAA